MKTGSFRCKTDKVAVHQRHAEARHLGFKRADKRQLLCRYKAVFKKKTDHEAYTLYKSGAHLWQAALDRTNWLTPWFESPTAAWLYGTVENWGEP